ncbi:MAG: ribosomal-processing cysteine protease Prp [Blautia sp.]|jgi:uncharacterized protein YsxB (DUF464 family)
MIKVTVTKSNGKYTEFHSSGHAGYAQEGQDIVCAAVSALVITTANALDAYTDDSYVLEEDDGYVSWRFQEEISERGTLLMDTLVLGLTEIMDSYGRNYLRLENKEV